MQAELVSRERIKALIAELKGTCEVDSNLTSLEPKVIELANNIATFGISAVDLLLQSLSDLDKDARRGAQLALALIKEPNSLMPLINSLSQDNLYLNFKSCDLSYCEHGQCLLLSARRRAVAQFITDVPHPDGIAYLISTLKNAPECVRIAAIEALAEIGDSAAVEPLISVFNNDSRMSWYAFKALKKIGDSRALLPVLEWLSEIKPDAESNNYYSSEFNEICDRRRIIFEAIIKLGVEQSRDVRIIDPLIGALKHQDLKNCQETVKKCLVRFGESAIEPLIANLTNENKAIRQSAEDILECLGGTLVSNPLAFAALQGDTGAGDILVRLWPDLAIEPGLRALEDTNINVKREGIKLLGKIGLPLSVEPLISALENSLDELIEEIAISLGNIGDRRAVGPLVNCLSRQHYLPHAGYVRSIMDAIQKIGLIKITDPELLRSLVVTLKYSDWGYRQTVINALIESGEGVIEPLQKACSDEDWALRSIALRTLGKIAQQIPEEILKKALIDEHEDVRIAAIETLAGTRNPATAEILIRCLADSSGNVRAMAIRALGRIKEQKAVEPLISFLTDRNQDVRYEAAVALGQLKDPGAIDHLVKAMNDKHRGKKVRVAAIDALGVIGDSRAEKSLRSALKNNAREFGDALRNALANLESAE